MKSIFLLMRDDRDYDSGDCNPVKAFVSKESAEASIPSTIADEWLDQHVANQTYDPMGKWIATRVNDKGQLQYTSDEYIEEHERLVAELRQKAILSGVVIPKPDSWKYRDPDFFVMELPIEDSK